MKKTTQDSIENTVIGRDNLEKEEFSKKYLKSKSIILDVKDTNTSLVGKFDIEVKKDKPQVKEYEPYHLKVVLNGVGNFEKLKPIEFKIEGVKVFAGEIKQNQELHKEGEVGEWSQKFAFVADKNFTIPKIEIEYFNLKDKKMDNLVLNPIHVDVKQGYKKKELLDKADENNFKFNFEYLYYFLAFLSGFLISKIDIKGAASKQNKNDNFQKKIDDVTSLDKLALILVMEDSKKYETLISDIEKKRVTSLSKAKSIIKNK